MFFLGDAAHALVPFYGQVKFFVWISFFYKLQIHFIRLYLLVRIADFNAGPFVLFIILFTPTPF